MTDPTVTEQKTFVPGWLWRWGVPCAGCGTEMQAVHHPARWWAELAETNEAMGWSGLDTPGDASDIEAVMCVQCDYDLLPEGLQIW